MRPRAENAGTAAAPAPVASYRHTAILTAVLLAVAVAGAVAAGASRETAEAVAPHRAVVVLYLSLLAAEWGLFAYVWRVGLRPHGTRLRDLVGGRWSGWQQAVRDLGLAAGLWLAWLGVEHGWDLWVHTGHGRSVGAYLPHGPVEVALWATLSLSAGFCEEVTFRGYFQQQLAALSRHRTAGVVLQAALFGVTHSYQGVAAALKIALFGLLYGGLAAWRRTLRPCIAAHAWTDIYAGWLAGLM
ncbi:MAG: CPBP family intramembrane metalloprotease [Acidobacteria bacterium]|nr:CPBP family intramembrane metalloprotease [Acidobacteriota bacterium]